MPNGALVWGLMLCTTAKVDGFFQLDILIDFSTIVSVTPYTGLLPLS